jgi:hypothetical protein
MPSQLLATTELTDVTVIQRRGIGPVYRATISLNDLYFAIRQAVIRYSPRYQRGYEKWGEALETDLDMLVPITDGQLQISNARAQMMAVKYLRGRLFTSHITWNARREPGLPEPDFDDEQNSLRINSPITVPDTAHRHRAYYWLVHWKQNPDELPETVEIDGGEQVRREEIEDLLENFDPEQEFIHCDVYVLNAEDEGRLYDEFNADLKAPSTAVAITLNPTKTPSRRFVKALMETSKLFSPDEVETRGNTIGSKSRKLTTIATLEAAARNMTKGAKLAELEDDRATYEDLVGFFGSFFEEWAQHFKVFRPGTTGPERHQFRDESFALSNLLFHPLFKLGYELWDEMRANDEDWRLDSNWKDGLARLAGSVEAPDPDTGQPVKVPVMSRKNPEWVGRILVPRFNADGERVGYIVSSTRQTRDAAYAYLREVAGI